MQSFNLIVDSNNTISDGSKRVSKIVALSGNSSLGVALKRCSNEANSSQEVAVLVYSAITDSSSLR